MVTLLVPWTPVTVSPQSDHIRILKIPVLNYHLKDEPCASKHYGLPRNVEQGSPEDRGER